MSMSGPTEASPLVKGGATRSVGQLLWTLLPALLGNMLEFYDYACYVSLTTEIASNMYAADDLVGRHFSIWLAFAFGQCVRPFGGALFGMLADRIGRQPTILAATSGMMICTVLMGCLPTRRECGVTCGWVGATLMVALRAVQGLCAAGEIVVVYTLAVEQSGGSRAGIAIASIGTSCVSPSRSLDLWLSALPCSPLFANPVLDRSTPASAGAPSASSRPRRSPRPSRRPPAPRSSSTTAGVCRFGSRCPSACPSSFSSEGWRRVPSFAR